MAAAAPGAGSGTAAGPGGTRDRPARRVRAGPTAAARHDRGPDPRCRQRRTLMSGAGGSAAGPERMLVARSAAHPRLSVVAEPLRGSAAARNAGVRAATGEVI